MDNAPNALTTPIQRPPRKKHKPGWPTKPKQLNTKILKKTQELEQWEAELDQREADLADLAEKRLMREEQETAAREPNGGSEGDASAIVATATPIAAEPSQISVLQQEVEEERTKNRQLMQDLEAAKSLTEQEKTRRLVAEECREDLQMRNWLMRRVIERERAQRVKAEDALEEEKAGKVDAQEQKLEGEREERWESFPESALCQVEYLVYKVQSIDGEDCHE